MAIWASIYSRAGRLIASVPFDDWEDARREVKFAFNDRGSHWWAERRGTDQEPAKAVLVDGSGEMEEILR